MTIIPCKNTLDKYLSSSKDKQHIDIANIFFNENVKVLFNKEYIEFIESSLDAYQIHLFQALILELTDSNRIIISADNSSNNIFEELYNKNVTTIDSLFAMTSNFSPEITHYDYKKIDLSKKNKEYLLYNLLAKNQIIFKYFDFTKDQDIKKVIKNLFELPHKLSRIYIYNRLIESHHLDCIVNKGIYYYNYIPSANFHKRKTKYINDLNDLKYKLGRNVKLYSTSNKSYLHERKIFFNHIAITFDNSLDYTIISDPSWQITIEIDNLKSLNNWKLKNSNFSELN